METGFYYQASSKITTQEDHWANHSSQGQIELNSIDWQLDLLIHLPYRSKIGCFCHLAIVAGG